MEDEKTVSIHQIQFERSCHCLTAGLRVQRSALRPTIRILQSQIRSSCLFVSLPDFSQFCQPAPSVS